MGNDSVAPSCAMPDRFVTARITIFMLAYYVTPPIMVLFGLSSHILAVVALHRESKKHFSFMYQVWDMTLTALCIVTLALAIATFRILSGFASAGSQWFMRNHALMLYSAHLAIPFANAIGLAALYISAVTALDRDRAMSKPQEYATMSHKTRLKISVCSSIFIGITVSAFDMFRYYLIFDEGRYVIVLDEAFITSIFARFAVHFRNLVLAAGVALVIVFNVKALAAFWKHSKRLSGIMTDKRAFQRRQTERTLLCLTLLHALQELAARGLQIAIFAIVFIRPSFLLCEGLLVTPLMEMVLELLLLTKVFCAACVSRPFRVSIATVLRSVLFRISD